MNALQIIWLVGVYAHWTLITSLAHREIKPWEKPYYVLRAFGYIVCWPWLCSLALWLGYRELTKMNAARRARLDIGLCACGSPRGKTLRGTVSRSRCDACLSVARTDQTPRNRARSLPKPIWPGYGARRVSR